MKATAKMTSKNQITVPRQVREALRLDVGDVLLFDSDESGIRVRAQKEGSPFVRYRGALRRGRGRTRQQVIDDQRRARGHEPPDEALFDESAAG